MKNFRSILFTIIFYLWIFIAMMISLPVTLSYKTLYAVNRKWAHSVLWLFKKTVGCDYKIEGLHNLPKEGGYIIASKHQSAWETIVPFTFLPKVVFVYKKELASIPIYGWYNKAFRNVKVDRASGATDIKGLVEQVKQRVSQGHQLIIFPQGTRTKFGVDSKYKSSVYAMYKAGLPVYPAALNSGNHWPKHGAKKPGTIIMKFLPAIKPGLDKKQFMERLSATIEVESNALDTSAKHGHGRCGCH